MLKPRLNLLSEYFKQQILTGWSGSNAPLLNDNKYLPFDVVPSGKINKGGK